MHHGDHGTQGQAEAVRNGWRTIRRHTNTAHPSVPSIEERAVKHAPWFFVIVLVLAACAPAADESPGEGAEGSAGSGGEAVEGSVRVALGDIEGVETLNLLIAL